MALKKKDQLNKYSSLIILVVIVVTLLFIVLFINNNKISRESTDLADVEQPISYDGSDSYITPTILPSTDQNKLQFNHPQDHFSFEYPKDWQVVITRRNVREPWYEVYLTDQNQKNRFRIHFMNGGRGGPYFEYETNEEKNINGRLINWNLMYIDNKAFEAYVSFPNNDFGDKFIGLYIYLPKENQEEFIQQVEEIIASLK